MSADLYRKVLRDGLQAHRDEVYAALRAIAKSQLPTDALTAPTLCPNCAPDGACKKRQALCEFTSQEGGAA